MKYSGQKCSSTHQSGFRHLTIASSASRPGGGWEQSRKAASGPLALRQALDEIASAAMELRVRVGKDAQPESVVSKDGTLE